VAKKQLAITKTLL